MESIYYISILTLAMSTVHGDEDNQKLVKIIGNTIRTIQGEFTLTEEENSEAIQWDKSIIWKNKDEHTTYECKKEGDGVETFHSVYWMECNKSKTTDSLPAPVYKVELYLGMRFLLSANVKTCSGVTDYIMVMQPKCEKRTIVDHICYKLHSKWTLYTMDKDSRVSLKEDATCGSYTGENVWEKNGSFDDIGIIKSDASDGNQVVKVRTVQGELKLTEEVTFDANTWEIQMSWKNLRETTFQRYTENGERGTLYHLEYRMECYKSRTTDPSSSPVYKIKLIGGGRRFLVADVTNCSRTPDNILILDPVGTTILIDRICFKLQNKWFLYTIDEDNRIALTEEKCDGHLFWVNVRTAITPLVATFTKILGKHVGSFLISGAIFS